MAEEKDKLKALRDILRRCESVAVAFSGGVDSTFLLKTAHEALGERAAAITGSAPFIPERELGEAAAFCAREGIRQIVVPVDMAAIPSFTQNPPDRCYLCKKTLFARFLEIAAENGFFCVAEGSNLDDMGDYRPGMRAIAELGIKSPLREAGLTKAEIRELSREMGLETWSKPSYACLASRFVYGETINEEKLRLVERAETYLMGMGFRQVRVRIHESADLDGNGGDYGSGRYLARIEVERKDIPRLMELREQADSALKAYGFFEVMVDPAGYRTGSMNEALKIREDSHD